MSRLIFFTAVGLILAACGADSTADEVRPTTTNPETENTRVSVAPATSIPSDIGVYLDESVVATVIDQAAEELEMLPTDLAPMVAAQVTWGDGSLNCPQPGQLYTQALVDGFWVVLTDGAQIYDYRAGSDGVFRSCQGGNPPATTYVDQ